MYLKTRFRTGFFGSIRIVVVDCKLALSSLITSISVGFAHATARILSCGKGSLMLFFYTTRKIDFVELHFALQQSGEI
jgi:hypothetical protein